MRSTLAAMTAVAFALALSVPASAQRRPDKAQGAKLDPKLAEAKKLFEDGVDAYTQGNYEVAIAAWEKSYELSKKPLIFESIANAYERLGDPRRARENLRRWREAAPPEEHGILDARLKNLDARVTREDEAIAARKAQPPQQQDKHGEVAPPPEAAPKAPSTSPPSKAPSSISVPALTLAIAGGATVLAGVTLDIVAASTRPDPKDVCRTDMGSQICTDAIVSSNTLAVVGDVVWIAGAAAVASGVVIFFLDKPKTAERASKTTVVPAVTPRSAGLLLQHRF